MRLDNRVRPHRAHARSPPVHSSAHYCPRTTSLYFRCASFFYAGLEATSVGEHPPQRVHVCNTFTLATSMRVSAEHNLLSCLGLWLSLYASLCSADSSDIYSAWQSSWKSSLTEKCAAGKRIDCVVDQEDKRIAPPNFGYGL